MNGSGAAGPLFPAMKQANRARVRQAADQAKLRSRRTCRLPFVGTPELDQPPEGVGVAHALSLFLLLSPHTILPRSGKLRQHPRFVRLLLELFILKAKERHRPARRHTIIQRPRKEHPPRASFVRGETHSLTEVRVIGGHLTTRQTD